MKNKSNIFVVQTEYHLIQTINIICNYYIDYENHIYVTQGVRLKEFKPITGLNTVIHLISKGYGNPHIYQEMEKLEPEKYFFFQDNSVDNMYLCYYFRKRGTKIALVQDGLKPYVKWNKRHLLLSTIKDTFKDYCFLIKNKAFIPSLVWMNYYDYGDWRFIDELWLTTPEAFNNKHRKKLIKIPEISDKTLSVLNDAFDYKGDEGKESVVLIIGQPTANSQNWSFDASLIEQITNKYPQNKIWYKPHPLTDPKHLALIKGIKSENFYFYSNNIPAELLILQLLDSIVVSRSSTAMLTYNKHCKYYWTHKMYPTDSLSAQLGICNPTSFIKEIKTVDEIVF